MAMAYPPEALAHCPTATPPAEAEAVSPKAVPPQAAFELAPTAVPRIELTVAPSPTAVPLSPFTDALPVLVPLPLKTVSAPTACGSERELNAKRTATVNTLHFFVLCLILLPPCLYNRPRIFGK